MNYSLAEKEDCDFLNEVLNNEDFKELSTCRIRFALIYVHTSIEDGVVIKSFNCLPYKVKLVNMKDRILKQIDVEIYVDELYWSKALYEKKVALINAALSQISVCQDKNSMPIFQDDGVVKLKLLKPDIIYTGFSNIIEKFGSNSPDIQAWDDLKSNFAGLIF